ncbi:MAG: helix-turn-helix domain-containing protein [Ruminococcaceae bacterium]|nr:helix-turn-helix domain-containing protein [Oscillospiraceae bacterium]
MYATLYEFINTLCYGTRLHVGVVFFGNYTNEKLALPHEHTIHASPVCEKLKNLPHGYARCFRCRNAAIRKALSTKEPFGGLCVNGVYEYTHPVTDDEKLICIIYIGNILESTRGKQRLEKKLKKDEALLDTLEPEFSETQCRETAHVIESYIRLLLKEFPPVTPDEHHHPTVELIKRYIAANIGYSVSLSELSSLFHYNEKYLGRLFRSETGMSLHEYVAEERLRRAEELLCNTEDSVLNISERVGFNNVTYFNRLFKRKHGKAPIAYRKDVRQYPEYRNK